MINDNLAWSLIIVGSAVFMFGVFLLAKALSESIGPQRAYLIFGDIEGKLDVLRVECTKCARKGRYHVHKLIEKYGRKANMMK